MRSVSNSISFKTLKKPSIKEIEIDADFIKFEVECECVLKIADYDLAIYDKQLKLEDRNICDEIRLILYEISEVSRS